VCGITGILAFADHFAVGHEVVERMRDTLKHRGPDDAGSWHEPEQRCALGHRRLSIVDLSPAGHQPMSNEDGTVWIAFNGEIYNHLDLRRELEAKGHVYRSHTDTETIIHLYEEEGPRCVERLHGMFGLAIWDARRRELFLARDRLGVKPLYVSMQPGGLLFGSEIKAILEHPSITPDLDEEALYHYLTFAFSPPPRTLYAGIQKLAAGERMLIGADGTVKLRDTYWSPLSRSRTEELAAMSDGEIDARLLELLRESIGKRMMSDVPFGVFLSGGVDSSVNVALMAEQTDQPVRTYSTAPKDHARYDELEYARIIAKKFGTDHHEIRIDDGDLADFIPQLLFHQDEPLADWTAVPQHFVTKLARDDGTVVVQVGEGADELFHGYKGYVTHRKVVVPFQRFVPQPVRRGVGTMALGLSERTGRGARHGGALYDASRSPIPYWGGAICFRGPLKDRLYRGSHSGEASYEVVERLWEEADGADLFQKMTYVELKQRLSELLLMRLDRITMASSVEGRDPFLDHELVEFAMALPPRLKYADGVGKVALKRAVRGIIPDEILDRRKQGFGTPMEEWLRGDFGRRAQHEVKTSSLAERGILDLSIIDGLFETHRAGRGDWSYHLWNVYSLARWHDTWIAGKSD
jgi:asparagine synthase (glutamine-hydrolysing)